jgi:protocatechuate 3,4-dioxygenase beta subunit
MLALALVTWLASPAALASTPAGSLSAVSFAPGDFTGGMATEWDLSFDTSSVGQLTTSDNITVTVPAGTGLPSAAGDYMIIVNGNGLSASSVSANGDTVEIPVPENIPASTSVYLQISDVTNPPVGSYPDNQFSVATTVDGAGSPTTQNGQVDFPAPSSGNPAPIGMSLTMQEDSSNPGNVTVTGSVYDANGAPVVGATVSLSASGVTLPSPTVTTDSNGQFSADFYASSNGTYTVIGQVYGTHVSGASSLTISDEQAPPATPSSVTLSVSPSSIPEMGTASVTGYVYDSNHQPMSYTPVELQAASGSLQDASVVTDANGEFTSTYTAGASAGSDIVTATVGGTNVSNSVPVTVTAPLIGTNATGMTLSISPAQILTGQDATVTGTVYDSNGQGVPNTTVELFPTGMAQIVPSMVNTDSSGAFTSTLQAPILPGQLTVTGQVYGTMVQNSASVDVVPDGHVWVNGQKDPAGIQLATYTVGGLLQIQLWSHGGQDLGADGLTSSDRIEVQVPVPANFTPQDAVSTGNILSFTPAETVNGQSVIDVIGTPATTSFVNHSPSTPDGNWPQKADTDYSEMLLFAVANSGNSPTQYEQDMRGAYVGTNAQSFTDPTYDSTTGGITFELGGPHFMTNGTTAQVGFFNAFIPIALIHNEWGISDASVLTTGSLGATITDNTSGTKQVVPQVSTVTDSNGQVTGVMVNYQGFQYSGDSISIQPIPTGLTHASVTSSGWTESWNAVHGASSYNVYVNGTKVASNVTSTSYNVTGESASTQYSVKVTAVINSNETPASAADTVTTNSSSSSGSTGSGSSSSGSSGSGSSSSGSSSSGSSSSGSSSSGSSSSGSSSSGSSSGGSTSSGSSSSGSSVVAPQLPSVLKTVNVDKQGSSINVTAGKATIEVTVPTGAFTTPETVTVTSGTPADVTKLVQGLSPSRVAAVVGVNFSGANPQTPITVTIHNSTIPAGAAIYKLLSDGQLVPVQAKVTNGVAVISFSSDPDFVVVALKPGERVISENGQTSVVPALIRKDSGVNTTFIPVYYVMQLLKSMGLTSSWDGHNWHITTNASVTSKAVSSEHGAMGLYLNGTLVANVHGAEAVDPNSHKHTTYMPIWYVMQLLNQANIHSAWNGTTWTLSRK